MDTLLTAEAAANSPRYRRRSSTYIDAIHDLPEKEEMAPAQLYSTESGRLFHSGRIVIATVGLPARGKTHISVAVARYLRWLGVKTHVFHLGDYRRATMGEGNDVPHDYFFLNASPSSVLLRNKILKKCREDIYHFLDHENGQVAIYDAVNAISGGRAALAREFAKRQIQTLFIESQCTDEKIIEENVRSVKISSPDYVGWKDEDAIKDYLQRIASRIPHFETMEEPYLHWIKMINAGERVIVNSCNFGYLSQRIVFYLLNLHIKSRHTYFARAGTTKSEDSYKADASLSPEGDDYARKMTDTLLRHRDEERKALEEQGGPVAQLKPLTVWTSTRRRTVETANPLADLGYRVRQRSQMSQLHPGVCEKMTEKKIRELFPEEVAKHEADPYHHRYPRAESYHDLAVRLEPIILELEREQNDLLIIAHESVLRVLYGYLMACNATDIPKLDFPRDEIIEIIPASYNNSAKRIHIEGLPPKIVPNSPEDIAMPVIPSGAVTPSPLPSAHGTPAHGTPRPPVPPPMVTISEPLSLGAAAHPTASATTTTTTTVAPPRPTSLTASNASPAANPTSAPSHQTEPPSQTQQDHPAQQQQQQQQDGADKEQHKKDDKPNYGSGMGTQGLAALAASRGRAGTITPQDGRQTPQPLNIKPTHVDPSS
ncbi:6-phosphofructo-2-kinase/fructose-2,6-biphosphatase 3 [Phyllosticta capitalensis]|uniref:6-phosphofructo-2-kinase/fructose-2, 6-biphosphatase 3 n=1 Tax=Phyllosticta capitalensis TaxID=121624 RepID=A0ABR1YKV0_9PEZI